MWGPKTNVTTIKHLSANEMIMTCQLRSIFTPANQTNEKLFISCNNLLNVTFQSHSTKARFLHTKENLFDCCNNQSHLAYPVHHGTFFKVLIH